MAPLKEIQLPHELISPLLDGHPYPAAIINRTGNIILVNEAARKFFNIQSDDVTIFELFVTDDREKITRIIESAFKFNGETVEYTEVTINEKTTSVEFSINAVKDEQGNKFLLVKIIKPLHGSESRGKAGFGLMITSEDLANLIKNKNIINIIENVKSSFPFTFLGKSKTQNEINKLAELFWIKDTNNNFILVNNRFSSLLGLKTSQLEGRSERSFLPQYYLDLYKTIDLYLKETLSYFILEGIPLKGFASLKNYQSVEFPLVDAEDRVQAIIGIGQKRESSASGEAALDDTGASHLFRAIPKPYILIDNLGYVKSVSRSFESLFSIEEANVTGHSINEILPEQLTHSIKAFLTAGRQTQEIAIDLTLRSDEHSSYGVTLTKLVSESKNSVKVLVGIEKASSFDNLEELLTSRGRMYDILIQSNPEPIYVYSTENLRFIEANGAALELYGYNRDEFLQMDLTDLYTPEDIQSLLESTEDSQTNNKFKGPFKHRKKDGTTVHVEICKTTFIKESKEAHFNIVRDVSEKLRIEQEHKLFQTTYENTSDVLILADNVGFIKEVNNAVIDKLGYFPGELIDSSFISLAQDEHRGLINTSIFYSHNSDVSKLNVELKKKDGSPVSASLVAVPVHGEGSQIEFYNLIVQITDPSRETIREVEKIVVKEVIKEVEKIVPGPALADQLQGRGGMGTAQIGTIFHEILTPINVILGFVQEIRESLSNPTGEQQEAMDYISQNRDNLLDTMNTIAEFAKLNAAPEDEISEIKASTMLEEVASEIENLFATIKKNLIFSKVSSSLSFSGYNSIYQNFMLSLVKICFKITIDEQIYVSAQSVDDSRFVISFKDNINKISSELLNNLVNLFNQDDISFVRTFNISRYAAMSVKKSIKILGGKVEILGKSGKAFEVGVIFPIEAKPYEFEDGDVHVSKHSESEAEIEAKNQLDEENEPLTVMHGDDREDEVVQSPQYVPDTRGRGVTPPATPRQAFPQPGRQTSVHPPPERQTNIQSPLARQTSTQYQRVQPAVPPSTPVVPAHQDSTLELASLSCLYIEDQVDSQILFKVQMKELGKMDFAVSFEDALPIITSQKFDFIVMDINLQGEYNGLDALKMIHKMPGFERMPIIAVTAYVLPGDREKFIAAGFNDFISKPIFREKMIEALEKVFLKKIV